MPLRALRARSYPGKWRARRTQRYRSVPCETRARTPHPRCARTRLLLLRLHLRLLGLERRFRAFTFFSSGSDSPINSRMRSSNLRNLLLAEIDLVLKGPDTLRSSWPGASGPSAWRSSAPAPGSRFRTFCAFLVGGQRRAVGFQLALVREQFSFDFSDVFGREAISRASPARRVSISCRRITNFRSESIPYRSVTCVWRGYFRAPHFHLA